MRKMTVYLPEDLRLRLEAAAVASGMGKTELIRRGVAMLIDSITRPGEARMLPVFNSGQPKNADALDESIYRHIKQQAARR